MKGLFSEKNLSVSSLRSILLSDLSGTQSQVLTELKTFNQNVKKPDSPEKQTFVKIQYENGDLYEGFYLENKFHGKGRFISKSMSYDGFWKHGFPHGKGREIWKSGAVYKGSFYFGQKWGHGSYLWPNKNLYEGSWAGDLMHGKGSIKYPNGDELNATFIKGMPRGICEFRFSNGNIFKGKFLNGKIRQLDVILRDSDSTCASANCNFKKEKRIRN